ncbi:MAG: hypothetical protein N3F65_04380 [Nitrososphaeria archaeon]|nr:hypothetical protein [Nitrososphaeria archaeon]
MDKLLSNAKNKSVIIIFLDFRDLEKERECRELSLTVRRLYLQYGKIIEFLTVIRDGEGALVKDVSSKEQSCWINNYPLWRHLIDLEGKTFRIYNITETPSFVIMDDKHQYVETIKGFVSEQRLEVALIRVICSCAQSFEQSLRPDLGDR